ncbi:hypothetical protein ACFYTQ_26085 [Nocardia sp. NPDC004068]|uniref:hypothetical protein n=1 Tax=Nocardia sp. NPDC004068 TaxID=3364303 RepID=UPI00368CBFF7
MTEPDSNAMDPFCFELVPGFLHEICRVDLCRAEAIGRDIFDRTESFAALDRDAQQALSAPFLEEVASYTPTEASLALRAAVTVVVRNSLLETVHAGDGPLNAGGITGLTTQAAAPLSHVLMSRRQQSVPLDRPNHFAELSDRYPRAWAALSAIAQAVAAGGGRVGYHAPDAPVPAMPVADEVAEVNWSTSNERVVVQSAIDEALNAHLVEQIRMVIEHQMPMYVPTLSRFSRNMDRLLYVIELLLAHDVPILTTNYLLRSSDVWVRKGRLLAPDNDDDVVAGLKNLDGLSGSHRKLVAAVREGLTA